MTKVQLDYLFMAWPLPVLVFFLFMGSIYDQNKVLHRAVMTSFLVIGGVTWVMSLVSFVYGLGLLGIEWKIPYLSLLYLVIWFILYLITLKVVIKLNLTIVHSFSDKLFKFWIIWLTSYPICILIAYFAL